MTTSFNKNWSKKKKNKKLQNCETNIIKTKSNFARNQVHLFLRSKYEHILFESVAKSITPPIPWLQKLREKKTKKETKKEKNCKTISSQTMLQNMES